MTENKTAIAVLGNVTLDIICKSVDDVPRHDSISFQEASVSPGGCGSNTAIGLAGEGEKVFLIACTGDDLSADLLHQTWEKTGVDTRFIKRFDKQGSGVSVGLVDSDFQPRFIHTTGANNNLRPDSIHPEKLIEQNVGFVHVAGYYVLPGLLDAGFEHKLSLLQEKEIFVSLDVVTSPAMKKPEYLWPLLPFLNLFLCNLREAEIITGHGDPESASGVLHQKGASAVIIKLGSRGCWLSESGLGKLIPAPQVENVIDTTGAGDAFAAGLLAALRKGKDLHTACLAGTQTGSKTVQFLGAVRIA
ncbi:MAG: carbohydrate kinase family protein [Anaerolineales bacterium]|nr:carbohydrate kinase family protein [Anaerolineales bacterium]